MIATCCFLAKKLQNQHWLIRHLGAATGLLALVIVMSFTIDTNGTALTPAGLPVYDVTLTAGGAPAPVDISFPIGDLRGIVTLQGTGELETWPPDFQALDHECNRPSLDRF